MTEKFFLDAMDEMFKPLHDSDGIDKNNHTCYFTEDDYRELNRNIVMYKQGSQEAVTYIVHMFHPFITKYAGFIKHGNLPYTKMVAKDGSVHYKASPTICSFAALYIENPEHADARKGTGRKRKAQLSSACYKIKDLFSKYEYSDIYNELVLALLNMANKYKVLEEGDKYYKKNGTFHMYVSKCFHFEAYRFLNKLVKDPLAHSDAVSLKDQFDEFGWEQAGNETFIEDVSASRSFEDILDIVSRQDNIRKSRMFTLKENTQISPHDNEALNFNWTNGVTCSEMFSTLSPYERELLVLSFIQKKTDEEISRIYGCHRVTVSVHRKAAVAKIRIQAEKLNALKK